MTGWWQVLGRVEIPFDEMVRLDYLYVTSWSFWNDCRLILKTFSVVFRGDQRWASASDQPASTPAEAAAARTPSTVDR